MGGAWKAAVVRGSRMLFVQSIYAMNDRVSNSSTVLLMGIHVLSMRDPSY